MTSGTFSPTLRVSLAMALVDPAGSGVGTRLTSTCGDIASRPTSSSCRFLSTAQPPLAGVRVRAGFRTHFAPIQGSIVQTEIYRSWT